MIIPLDEFEGYFFRNLDQTADVNGTFSNDIHSDIVYPYSNR